MKIDNISTFYHGTSKKFEHFEMKYAKRFKDFGKGFYLTTSFKQAQKWAQQKANTENSNITYIYQYIIENVDYQKYKILELLQYDEKWLDFIVNSRISGMETDYDIIYDRMADNRGNIISQTLDEYKRGIKSASETISLIHWKIKDTNQYCFKTKEALKLLKNRTVTIQQKDNNGIWKIVK